MNLRVALISDTHGFLDPRVEKQVRCCDYAVHAGDVGGESVLSALRPRGGSVVAVCGNNDVAAKWPVTEHDRLSWLPTEAELVLPGGRLVVVHGHRAGPSKVRHQRLRRTYPDARAVVYGHSHRLGCDMDLEPWVLNPGAAGRVRTYGGPSCLILTVHKEVWSVETVRFPPLHALQVSDQTA